MASIGILFHFVILLAYFQVSSAYCYGYCWYSSWYIWIAVIIVIGVCCGGLGGYLRRRRLRNSHRQTTIITSTAATAVPGTYPAMPPMTDMSRPYVYPGVGQFPPGGGQPGGGQFPPGGSQFPPGGGQFPPGSNIMMTPPPYTAPEKLGAPPSYETAVTSPATYNHGDGTPATGMSEGSVPTTPYNPAAAPYPTGNAPAPYPTENAPAPYPTTNPQHMPMPEQHPSTTVNTSNYIANDPNQGMKI